MNAPENRPAWFVLTQNWVSLAGVFLVTTAAISWLFVLPLQIRGHVDNPYIGIIVFLILPIIFLQVWHSFQLGSISAESVFAKDWLSLRSIVEPHYSAWLGFLVSPRWRMFLSALKSPIVQLNTWRRRNSVVPPAIP